MIKTLNFFQISLKEKTILDLNQAIVYYITRGVTERLHECEVCCPSETRAAITRNAFAVFCFE